MGESLGQDEALAAPRHARGEAQHEHVPDRFVERFAVMGAHSVSPGSPLCDNSSFPGPGRIHNLLKDRSRFELPG